MKKFFLISFIIGFSYLLVAQFTYADFSERVKIDEVNSKRNIVITHPHTSERYLINVKSGCGEFKEGQNVSLVVRGNLDAINDSIKVDYLHSCDIDQAEKFDQKLLIKYVYMSNTQAWVTDESGQDYFLTYGKSCAAMRSFLKEYVYVFQGDKWSLAKGDRLFLPSKTGQCAINYIRERKIIKSRETEDSSVDRKAPTMVTHVKAFPANGKAYLSWYKAKDDVGISHYIVSYDSYKIDTRDADVPLVDMPNQIKTKNINLTVENLENDRTYYFYVLAVDTSGNVSSEWSDVVEARPKSSILPAATTSSAPQDMDLRIERETSRSFLFEWDRHPNVNRYSVVLYLNNKVEYSVLGYAKNSIRILKRPHRAGEKLTLKVKAYSLRSLIQEKEIDFQF